MSVLIDRLSEMPERPFSDTRKGGILFPFLLFNENLDKEPNISSMAAG